MGGGGGTETLKKNTVVKIRNDADNKKENRLDRILPSR